MRSKTQEVAKTPASLLFSNVPVRSYTRASGMVVPEFYLEHFSGESHDPLLSFSRSFFICHLFNEASSDHPVLNCTLPLCYAPTYFLSFPKTYHHLACSNMTSLGAEIFVSFVKYCNPKLRIMSGTE